ncbi:MAG: hypothetical protein ABIG68_09895 [Acidobacteriota bacterium]
MRTCPLLLMLLAVLFFCFTQTKADDTDKLLEQAVAEAEQNNSDQLDIQEALREQHRAEQQLAVGAVRLGLLKARVRHAQGRHDEAIDMARKSLEAADHLEAEADREALRVPLLLLIEKAEQARESREIADQPPVTAPLPAQPMRGRAAPAPVDTVVADHRPPLDRLIFRSQEDLDADHRAEVRDRLDRGGDAPTIWQRVLVYPADWEELSRRREKYRDGTIYKGPEFRNEQGEVRQTVVYDIRSLVHPVVDFGNPPQLDLGILTQTLADRAALRRTSAIFTGYADQLAAGIPLLGYFGGVDEDGVVPAFDDRAHDDLMRIVHEVLEAD